MTTLKAGANSAGLKPGATFKSQNQNGFRRGRSLRTGTGSARGVVGARFSGDFRAMPTGRQAPLGKVVGVEADAEKVCGDEAELRGAHADDANHDAIQRRNDPAVPHFASDHYRGDDSKHAGNVIESQHFFHHRGPCPKSRSLTPSPRRASGWVRDDHCNPNRTRRALTMFLVDTVRLIGWVGHWRQDQSTGGSTGLSKGAMCSRGQLWRRSSKRGMQEILPSPKGDSKPNKLGGPVHSTYVPGYFFRRALEARPVTRFSRSNP